MKSQHIPKKESKKTVQIVDNRTPRVEPPAINVHSANKPVRCVNFVEVGDLDRKQVQLMVQELGQLHSTAQGGIHYFLPLRHGKLNTDIIFEKEILTDLVDKLCEVQDGKIVLKDGAKDVEVIRRQL
jgi:hypothetical protein